MAEKQETITKKNNAEKVTEEEFYTILRTVAPGTNLRAALNGTLKAGKGAIIAIENDMVPQLIDGGFRINAKFTPQKLIELTKMDGAIILSSDAKKINYANVLLTPSSKIKTVETGTRHKAAERMAKQTGTLVIAISERKNEITLYYKNIRHTLVNSDELLRKANEHIQFLEKQRELFDISIKKLTNLEMKNYPSLNQAITSIQKGTLITKIAKNLQKYIIELGNEGTLLKSRLKELITDVEKETDLITKDYTKTNSKKSRMILNSLVYEEISSKEVILKALDYQEKAEPSSIKGWRILSKTSLPEKDIAMIIQEASTLGKAIHSPAEFYRKIIGEERAKIFKNDIEKLKLNL